MDADVVELDHPVRGHVAYMQATKDPGDVVYKLLRQDWGDVAELDNMTPAKLKKLAAHWQALKDACPKLPYMLDLDQRKAEEYKALDEKMMAEYHSTPC